MPNKYDTPETPCASSECDKLCQSKYCSQHCRYVMRKARERKRYKMRPETAKHKLAREKREQRAVQLVLLKWKRPEIKYETSIVELGVSSSRVSAGVDSTRRNIEKYRAQPKGTASVVLAAGRLEQNFSEHTNKRQED